MIVTFYNLDNVHNVFIATFQSSMESKAIVGEVESKIARAAKDRPVFEIYCHWQLVTAKLRSLLI